MMIIGLDCAEPSLVLERWRDELPTLSGLMERGRYGRADLGRAADHGARLVLHDGEPHARATWASTASATAPTTRTTTLFIANGSAIHEPRLWDLASRYGKRVDRPRRPGHVPAAAAQRRHGQLLPDAVDARASTRTRTLLRREVEQVVGEYLFDCTNFRTDDKDDLLRQVYEMTDRRFALAEHLLATQAVGALRDGRDGRSTACTTGSGRTWTAHHRARSRRARTRTRSSTTTAHVDELDRRGCSSTPTTRPPCSSSPTTAPSGWTAASASTSGCGARACCATLREPDGVDALADVGVDWSQHRRPGARAATTRASSSTSRAASPRASSPAHDYERVRDELAERLGGDPGRPAASRSTRRVYKPEEVYDEVNGVAPDLHRPLRRPRLARGRHDRRRRGRPHVRERHRARTTPTTPRTAC